MVDDEQHGAAVDAAGEADANRRLSVAVPVEVDQPFRRLVRQRADVSLANRVEVRGKRPAVGCEEARVGRLRIRAADERQLHDVVRRHHPRVAGVKLVLEARVDERRVQRVDAIRDEQRRAFVALRQEIPHRPIQRPRQADGDAVDGDDGKRPVDGADGGGVAAEHSPAGLVEVQVVEAGLLRVEQVDDAFDGAEHHGIVVRQRVGGVARLRLRSSTFTHNAPTATNGNRNTTRSHGAGRRS